MRRFAAGSGVRSRGRGDLLRVAGRHGDHGLGGNGRVQRRDAFGGDALEEGRLDGDREAVVAGEGAGAVRPGGHRGAGVVADRDRTLGGRQGDALGADDQRDPVVLQGGVPGAGDGGRRVLRGEGEARPVDAPAGHLEQCAVPCPAGDLVQVGDGHRFQLGPVLLGGEDPVPEQQAQRVRREAGGAEVGGVVHLQELAAHGVQFGLLDAARAQPGEGVDEAADDRVLLLRQCVRVGGEGGELRVARGVVGLGGVGVAALLAQVLEEGPAEDVREDGGRGGAAQHRGEHDLAVVALDVGRGDGQRAGRGRGRRAGARGEAEVEALGYAVAGDPQHRVVPGEAGLGPVPHPVGGEAPGAQLVVAGQAVALGAVPPQRERGAGAAAAARRLGAQDLLLGLQPVHRQVPQAGAHAVEVGDDLLLTAGDVEEGVRVRRRAVVVQVGQAEAVQGEVLD
nr:hypothetical protein [Streptomyces phaeoluteigriseus]